MTEKKDIHNILEILDAAEFALTTAEKVLSNGKLDLFDAPVLLGSIGEANRKISAAIEGSGEIMAEVKDLSQDEAQQILDKAVGLAHAVAEIRKSFEAKKGA